MFLNFLMIFLKYETNKFIIIHPSRINKKNIVDYVSRSYYLQAIKGYFDDDPRTNYSVSPSNLPFYLQHLSNQRKRNNC